MTAAGPRRLIGRQVTREGLSGPFAKGTAVSKGFAYRYASPTTHSFYGGQLGQPAK